MGVYHCDCGETLCGETFECETCGAGGGDGTVFCESCADGHCDDESTKEQSKVYSDVGLLRQLVSYGVYTGTSKHDREKSVQSKTIGTILNRLIADPAAVVRLMEGVTEEAEATPQAKLKGEAEAKAALQAKLKGAEEANAALQARLKGEAEAKTALQSRMKANEEAKTALQAQLKGEEEANAALQSRMKANEEAKTALQAQLIKGRDNQRSHCRHN